MLIKINFMLLICKASLWIEATASDVTLSSNSYYEHLSQSIHVCDITWQARQKMSMFSRMSTA